MNALIKRLANLTLVGGVCLSVGVGCVGPDDEPQDRPNNPDVCEEINSGEVSSGATLSSDSCYKIDGSLNVSSGKLVIEAGTTVFMGAGSSIQLSGTGTIEAVGEEGKEILIRGEEQERGYWAGIYINDTGTSNHVLEYVTIRHAGGDRFTGNSESKGAVYVGGESRLSVSNCAFEQNAFAGIHAHGDSSTLSVETTSFTDNELPLRLRPDHFAALAGDLTISENDADHILMTDTRATATISGTWPGYAYRIPYDISMNADITIAAGATLELAQDVRITIADDTGSLNIAGTESARVTLQAVNGERGGWGGIHFSDASSANNRISYALIAHGGGKAYSGNGDARGAVFIDGDASRLTIENTTFDNNDYAALHAATREGEVNVSGSTFSNNANPLLTRPNQIGGFSADLAFVDNDRQAVTVFYNSTGAVTKLTRDQTWPAFEVPVRLSADIIVEGHLTLSPGSTFEAESDRNIDVSGGRLTADASSGDAIVFKGTEELSGYWQGLRFADSRFPDNKLINVELINAGSDRWTGNSDHQASLFIDGDSRVTVTDVTVTGSGLHGVFVGTGGELVGCTGLNISGSAGEDFFGAVADASACLPL
ncbi:hypothetical protein DV096_10435 [Bradymonadaceae bacterium TMQ3]|nr:hypothetical protein DV096_10435 [Bradymonadaceae bacterium TMQ3]TXC75892.1 hypothetical protein FRC91_10340 [Bradymonadales bacterium TMQ1]